MPYKQSASKTDLGRKGTAGRDCSPRTHQQTALKAAQVPSKPPRGTDYAGVGTPLGGKPPEAKTTGQSVAQGVIDPGMFTVDAHAVRAFSRYWEGKRAGPDWLHKRVEEASDRRMEEGLRTARRS